MRAFARVLLRPAYLACVVLFVGHQVAQGALGRTCRLVDGYLDPFLSIPLLLGLAEAERRWLLRGRGWRGFSALEVAAMTAALAALFEYGFPRLDPARQIYDPYDFLAYAFGGLAYARLVAGRPRSCRLGGA